MKRLIRASLPFVSSGCIVLLSGCAGSLGDIGATDPVERGLSYIAAAIVTNGVISAYFND